MDFNAYRYKALIYARIGKAGIGNDIGPFAALGDGRKRRGGITG